MAGSRPVAADTRRRRSSSWAWGGHAPYQHYSNFSAGRRLHTPPYEEPWSGAHLLTLLAADADGAQRQQQLRPLRRARPSRLIMPLSHGRHAPYGTRFAQHALTGYAEARRHITTPDSISVHQHLPSARILLKLLISSTAQHQHALSLHGRQRTSSARAAEPQRRGVSSGLRSIE